MVDTFRFFELVAQGFQCSQVLVILALEAQQQENPQLVRAMHGLAGGIGFGGDVCGTLSGAACVIALYAGRGTVEESEDENLRLMIDELSRWFAEQCRPYGGTCCRDIVGDDAALIKARCPDLIARTFDKTAEILANYGYDLETARP
jgi:C_GCAxxG_C_C family probable redox protein